MPVDTWWTSGGHLFSALDTYARARKGQMCPSRGIVVELLGLSLDSPWTAPGQTQRSSDVWQTAIYGELPYMPLTSPAESSQIVKVSQIGTPPVSI
jgi:hypothetical protein